MLYPFRIGSHSGRRRRMRAAGGQPTESLDEYLQRRKRETLILVLMIIYFTVSFAALLCSLFGN